MKKESIRKLSIAHAAILGLGALLYLSGLVAQLLIVAGYHILTDFALEI